MTTRDRFTRFYLLARRSGDDPRQALRYALARCTSALLKGWR